MNDPGLWYAGSRHTLEDLTGTKKSPPRPRERRAFLQVSAKAATPSRKRRGAPAAGKRPRARGGRVRREPHGRTAERRFNRGRAAATLRPDAARRRRAAVPADRGGGGMGIELRPADRRPALRDRHRCRADQHATRAAAPEVAAHLRSQQARAEGRHHPAGRQPRHRRHPAHRARLAAAAARHHRRRPGLRAGRGPRDGGRLAHALPDRHRHHDLRRLRHRGAGARAACQGGGDRLRHLRHLLLPSRRWAT